MAAAVMPAHVAAWLANEDGRSIRVAQRSERLREHPVTCLSLGDVWLPRRGGYTDLCELEDCPGCGLTFRIDGAGMHYEEDSVQRYLDEGDTGWYDASWCDCCWRAKHGLLPSSAPVRRWRLWRQRRRRGRT